MAGPQPSALDPTGGHHPALLFAVYAPLDGVKARVLHKELTWEAPPPPEGTLPRSAPRPQMLRQALPSVSFAVGKGSTGAERNIKGAALPGWMQGGSKVLGDHKRRWGLPWQSSG